MLKKDLPQITSAEFNDFVLQKLSESKFYEIAFLIKGYALTLLKQLRLISAQLAALVALDVRERAAPRRPGERAERGAPGLPLDLRLQNSLSREHSNPRELTPGGERLRAAEDLPRLPEEQLRWDSSMRRALEGVDDFGARPLLAPPEQDLHAPLDELLGVDEEQLHKLDELYLPSTPNKTKPKAARAEALRRVEKAIADVEKLAAVRAAFEEALQRTPVPAEPVEELAAATAETDAILDVLKGAAADQELLANIQRLNHAAEGVEARRALAEPESLSRHGFISVSRSEGVSGRKPEEEQLLEAPNLDMILETLNENPTRTHFLGSLGSWPRLEGAPPGPAQASAVQRAIAQAAAPGRKMTFDQLMAQNLGHHPADVFCQLLEMQARGQAALEQKNALRFGPLALKLTAGAK